MISLHFKKSKESKNEVRMSGWVSEKEFEGDAYLEDGKKVKWSAIYEKEIPEKEKKKKIRFINLYICLGVSCLIKGTKYIG